LIQFQKDSQNATSLSTKGKTRELRKKGQETKKRQPKATTNKMKQTKKWHFLSFDTREQVQKKETKKLKKTKKPNSQ